MYEYMVICNATSGNCHFRAKRQKADVDMSIDRLVSVKLKYAAHTVTPMLRTCAEVSMKLMLLLSTLTEAPNVQDLYQQIL